MFGHFVFGVLKIRMNDTPVFDLDAYTEKHWLTFCHSAGANFNLWFLSWHFLILQCCPVPVFPNTKATSFILAEVYSSSFLLASAWSCLDFSCFFSSMSLSHGLSNLCLLFREDMSLIFLLYLGRFTRFQCSILWPCEPDVKTFFRMCTWDFKFDSGLCL